MKMIFKCYCFKKICFKYSNSSVHSISRIVDDSVDLSLTARIQILTHSNQSIHWNHQYTILDRVTNNLDVSKPRALLTELQLSTVLPMLEVQNAIKEDCVLLVSWIITTYLKAFQHLRRVVVHHIPHHHSDKMAQKSQIVSMIDFFANKKYKHKYKYKLFN